MKVRLLIGLFFSVVLGVILVSTFHNKTIQTSVTKAPVKVTNISFEEQTHQAIAINDNGGGLTRSTGITTPNCKSFYSVLDNTKSQIITNQITQSLRALQAEGIEEAAIDYFSLYTAIGVQQGRLLRIGYSNSATRPLYASGDARLASGPETALVEDYLNSENIELIKDAIDSNKLSSSSYYPGENSVVYLLSLIMERKADSAPLIEQLLDVGLQPMISDFVHASYFDVSLDVLKEMHMSSDMSTKQALKSNGRIHSLVTHAIENHSISHAHYWIEQGESLVPDQFLFSALDSLIKNQEFYTESEIKSLATSLILEGGQPNFVQTYQELFQILPKDITSGLRYGIELDIPIDKIHFSEEKASRFFEAVIALSNDEQQVPSTCHSGLAKRYIRQALNNSGLGKTEINAKTVDQQMFSNVSKMTQTDKIISLSANIEPTDFDDVNSISGKSSNGLKLKKSIETRATEINRQISETSSYDEVSNLTERVIELISQKRWFEALSLLQTYEAFSIEGAGYTVMLNLSLYQSPPTNFIEHLLENGAFVSDHEVSLVIKNDLLDIAKLMVNKGVDFDITDSLGRSSLSISVESRAVSMFNFLLDLGIRESATFKGIDALDIALRDFESDSTSKYFVESLIRSGIVIEESHKEWTAELYYKDLNAYFLVVKWFN